MKKMGFVVSSIVTAVIVAGCSRQPDPSAGAEKALKDANLNEVKVDWDRDARVAHLTQERFIRSHHDTLATPVR